MGVQIHTQDPITTQTVYNANAEDLSRAAKATASSSYAYPPAQPGAAAPTSTSTIPQRSSYGPPAPQPGATPVPPPPTITAQPSLPPPPKAGEKPLSPEHHARVHSLPAQPQPYPSQMLQPTVDCPSTGVPPGSTTSTSIRPSFDASARPSNIPSSTDVSGRASLEHPPGYVQNPFASDMTPDQRFAAEQENENRSDALPWLGYVDDPKGPRPGFKDDTSVWGIAKKWVKEQGEQASKLEEKFWDKFGREK